MAKEMPCGCYITFEETYPIRFCKLHGGAPKMLKLLNDIWNEPYLLSEASADTIESIKQTIDDIME